MKLISVVHARVDGGLIKNFCLVSGNMGMSRRDVKGRESLWQLIGRWIVMGRDLKYGI